MQLDRFFGVLYGLALFGTIHLGPKEISQYGIYLGPVIGVLITVLWDRMSTFSRCYVAVASSALWSVVLLELLKANVVKSTLEGPLANTALNVRTYAKLPTCLEQERIRSARMLADNFRDDVQVREMLESFRHIAQQAKTVHDAKLLLEKALTGAADWLETKGFSCTSMINGSTSPVRVCQESLEQARRDCSQAKGGPLCDIVRTGQIGCSFISQTMTKSCDVMKNNIRKAFKSSGRKLQQTISRHFDNIIEIRLFGNQTEREDHLSRRWMTAVAQLVPFPSVSFSVLLDVLSWLGLVYFFLGPLYFVAQYTQGSLRWRRQKMKRRNQTDEELFHQFEKISWRPKVHQLFSELGFTSILLIACSACFLVDWTVAYVSAKIDSVMARLDAADLRLVSIDFDDSSASAGLGRVYGVLKRVLERSAEALSLKAQLACVPRNLQHYDVYAPFAIFCVALVLATVLQSWMQRYPLHVAGRFYPERRKRRFLNFLFYRGLVRIAQDMGLQD